MTTNPTPKAGLLYLFDSIEDSAAFQKIVEGLTKDPIALTPDQLQSAFNNKREEVKEVTKAFEPEKPMSIREKRQKYLSAMLEVLDFHGAHLSKQVRSEWMFINIFDDWCETSNSVKAEVPERTLILIAKNHALYAYNKASPVYQNIPLAQRRLAYLLDHPNLKEVGRGWSKMIEDHKYDVFDKGTRIKPHTELQTVKSLKTTETNKRGRSNHKKYHADFLPAMLNVYLTRYPLSESAKKEWLNINIRNSSGSRRNIYVPSIVSKEVSQRNIHQLELTYEAYLDATRCHHDISKCKQRLAYMLDHPNINRLGSKAWSSIEINPAYANL